MKILSLNQLDLASLEGRYLLAALNMIAARDLTHFRPDRLLKELDEEARSMGHEEARRRESNIEKLEELLAPVFPEPLPPFLWDMAKLRELLRFSDRYEISVQFWPDDVFVDIEKDGVEIFEQGGGFDTAIGQALDFLKRINQ